ncbi:MAG TPA: hypothetical protein PLQ93_11925 [Bacteroidia bacterium]|nr:hypothetical protein [Bacteroidia bacterium]
MKKVWAFSISKALEEEKLQALLELGKQFVQEWTAHENKLHADFTILNNRIILVQVDESIYQASGCSIDKLMRLIKNLEDRFKVELLNRMLVPVEHNGQLEILHSSEIRSKLQKGELTSETLVYNTAISNSDELTQWKQPIKSSWLSRFLN